MSWLLDRLKRFKNLKFEILKIREKAESISRQLRSWCDSLQNSPIHGQRYLTEKTKRLERQAREREEFLKELDRIRSGKA